MIAKARVACAAVAASGDFEAAAAAEALWRSYACAVKNRDAAERSAAFLAACASTSAATAAVSPTVASAWSASLADAFDLLTTAGPVAANSGNFEWVDGVLLKAMAAGDWVLLDNANLCSPTVLDRLNPLLEPAGELLVPEAGLVGGAPLIATPAPGFRLLLALDPSHGEVSRAMRNRGIEVFLLQSDGSSPLVRARQDRSVHTRIASIRLLADATPSGKSVSTWVRGQTLRTATLVGAHGKPVCGLDSPCSEPVRARSSCSCCVFPSQTHLHPFHH